MERPGTPFALEVNPKIPRRLARLDEIAHDLWYSWDRSTRQLFARLDNELWNAVGHSPKVLLKCIDERRLTEARVLGCFRQAALVDTFEQHLGTVTDRVPKLVV